MDQRVDAMDLAKLAMAAMGTSLAGSAAKSVGAAQGQFQKLLEQRTKPAEKQPAQSQKPAEQDKTQVDQPAEQPAKPEAAEGKADPEEQIVGIKEKPQQEDPLEQAKKLAEMGAAFFQPEEDFVWIDGDLETGEIYGVYGPEDYIIAKVGDQTVNIPIAGLDDQQADQLQQIVGDLQRLANAEDPEGDAMLEATDPNADHSLGKVLEKLVDEQAGKTVDEAAEKAVGQVQEEPEEQKDESVQAELVDVEQGPRQLFHEVKAAPIKVAESYDPQQAESVNDQIAAQVIPAMEQGQTKVELQLTPEHLGSVKVEITQSENGALHVAITAQNSQTRNMLEKHSDNLQNLLAQRTQNSVQVEVQRQEESQPKNPYDGHNGQHPQQGQEHHGRQRQPANSQDFIHQLRLGLVAEDEG